MAKLLDPLGEYLSAKVISRKHGTQEHQKGLDILLGQDSAILILDDAEDVGTSVFSWISMLNQFIFTLVW